MEEKLAPIVPTTPATPAEPAAPAITVEPAKAASAAASGPVVADSDDDEDDDVEDNEVVLALEKQIEKLKRKIAGKAEKRTARKSPARKKAIVETKSWFRPVCG